MFQRKEEKKSVFNVDYQWTSSSSRPVAPNLLSTANLEYSSSHSSDPQP